MGKTLVLKNRWNETLEFDFRENLIETLKYANKYTVENDLPGFFFETEDADEEYVKNLPVFTDEFGAEIAPCDYEIKGEENMNELMIGKCLEWLDYHISKEDLVTVFEEDDDEWHKRIYLAVWNDDDGYTHAYILRVWTMNNGKTIEISQDYCNHTGMEYFVDTIPNIVEVIKRIAR